MAGLAKGGESVRIKLLVAFEPGIGKQVGDVLRIGSECRGQILRGFLSFASEQVGGAPQEGQLAMRARLLGDTLEDC